MTLDDVTIEFDSMVYISLALDALDAHDDSHPLQYELEDADSPEIECTRHEAKTLAEALGNYEAVEMFWTSRSEQRVRAMRAVCRAVEET